MIWFFTFLLGLALWGLWNGQKSAHRQIEELTRRLARLEESAPPQNAASPRPADLVRAPVQGAEVATETIRREGPTSAPLRAPSTAPSPDAIPSPAAASVAKATARDRPTAHKQPPVSNFNLGEMLAERGLAWLGGGALALGGVFLVGYAAQQGLMTPLVRLIAAVALAAVMLLASEVLRRRPGPRSQRLASAVLAGAGASTLYATLWAANALYHYTGPATTAGLLLAVSGLLLVLSTRQRQPLALLALFGGLAAPLLTGPQNWNDLSLFLHLMVVSVAVLSLAHRRGWTAAALAATSGGLLLHLSTSWDGEIWRLTATPLLLTAMALTWRAAYRQRTTGAAPTIAPAALILASLSLFALTGLATPPSFIASAAAAGGLIAMVAFGVRRQWLGLWLLLPPALFMLISTATALMTSGRLEEIAHITGPLTGFALTLASLWAVRLPGKLRADLVIAPVAVFLFALLSTFDVSRDQATVSVLLATLPAILAATWLGLRSPEPRDDSHLDAWTLSAAAGLLLALMIRAPTVVLPTAIAAAALLAALLQRRLVWRGLSVVAMVCAGLCLALSLKPDFIVEALSSQGGAVRAVGACLTASALLALSAWRNAPAAPFTASRQVLAAASGTMALFAAFLGLRYAATGETPALSLFMEASLRTLLLALSGASALLILRDVKGLLARCAPHLLLVAAAISALALQLLLFNPWWGPIPARLESVPLLDSLLLAFLAPAAVFAVAAARLHKAGQPPAAGVYAMVSGVLATAWAVLETRHLFHGADLRQGATSFAEICAYGVIFCGLPLVLPRLGPATARAALRQTGEGLGQVLIPLAAVMTLIVATPWWGLAPLDPGEPVIAALLLAAIAVLTGLHAQSRSGVIREAGLVLATLQALALVTLGVRWGFHPVQMQASTIIGLETWTYSALWALGGAALLTFGSARGERALRWLALGLLFATAAKVLLFDMANLDGVIRAGSFLAVGAVMVAAAVLARRLGRSPNADKAPAFTSD